MSQIIEKNALFLSKFIGSGGHQDGPQYEMLLLNAVTPGVRSLTTGRTFSLGWGDIIEQAVAAGIDNEPVAVPSPENGAAPAEDLS